MQYGISTTLSLLQCGSSATLFPLVNVLDILIFRLSKNHQFVNLIFFPALNTIICVIFIETHVSL